MARCSICYTVINPSDPTTTCSDCQQGYHTSCWTEIGGCGTYGCKQAAIAEKPPVPVLVGQGWGDTKPCPACSAQISSSLLVCSTCRARFPWADPMTASDYRAWVVKEEGIASTRRRLFWMFILSLIGVTAPVIGPAAGIYAHARREELAGTGGTYLAMGYGSAVLGAIYAILIVLVVTGH